jgi:hypothetical protein
MPARTEPFCIANIAATRERAMSDERRKDASHSTCELRADLNVAQLDTLGALERFGWELKFIRHPIFQASIPVIFDGDRKTFAILEADGNLNEHPPFDIRHG